MKKLYSAIIAVFMALLMAVITPLQVLAAAQPKYIGEIVMAYGKSDLEANGYTVVDVDINAGNNSDRDVFIGYKTTDDPTEAVTDIKMLAQGNGYSVIDSNELFGYFEAEALEDAIGLYEVITIFRERFEAGEIPAKLVYTALQSFYYDKADDLKLGDYLIDEELDSADLTDIILYANQEMLQSLYQLLAIAVYSGREGDMWLGRYTAGETCQKANTAVKANSKYLLAAIKAFQVNLGETWEDGVEDATGEDGEATEQDMSLISLTQMASYSRGDKTMLDIFTDTDITATDLYDMAFCMNETDVALVRFMGVDNFFAASAEGMFDFDVDTADELMTALDENYSDTEFDFFESSAKDDNTRVAITNDMIREMTINDETGEFEFSRGKLAGLIAGGAALVTISVILGVVSRNISKALPYAIESSRNFEVITSVQSKLAKFVSGNLDSTAMLAVRATTTELSNIVGGGSKSVSIFAKSRLVTAGKQWTYLKSMNMDEIYAVLRAELPASDVAAFKNISSSSKVKCLQGIKASTSSAADLTKAARAASSGFRASIVLDIIFVAIAVFVALVELNDYYHFMWGDDGYSERPEAVYSLLYNEDDQGKYVKYIPAYLIDAEGTFDDVADSNGYEGSEWNALFYTKSLTAGTPIRAGSISADGGYGRTPFSEFGKTNAFNLNWGAKSKLSGGSSEINMYFEHTDENTLASIFSSPTGIALTAGILLILGGGIFALISARKKKKAEAEQ